mgnify:CR=1 FL=1
MVVVVALGLRGGDDLDLPAVEPETLIDRANLRLGRLRVRQEDAACAALDDGRRDRRTVDIAKALGGENDRGVLLPERLQPLAELTGEALVIERQPALVDDDERRRAVEAVLDSVEEIGQDRGRRAGADPGRSSDPEPQG